MHRRSLALAAITAGWLASCQSTETARPAPSRARATDKAALFGDPTLVPTRAGERARQEVGLAQEIETALSVLPSIEQAQANVELPRRETESPRVLVVLRTLAHEQQPPLVERAQRVARSVAGPTAAVEVIAEATPPRPNAPEPSAPWLLMVAVLGLGFCSGVLMERTRRLGSRSPRRRSR